MEGKIQGNGKMENGHAYINYLGSYPSTNETWRGVAIISIPTDGPATGYWMTYHHITKGGYYGFGSITLERRL